MAAYQNRVAIIYNISVKHKSFQIHELVLTSVKVTQKKKYGKLSENGNFPTLFRSRGAHPRNLLLLPPLLDPFLPRLGLAPLAQQ